MWLGSIHREMFPEVQGGGSLILAWQVRNKKVLVIGGGEVSLPYRYGRMRKVLTLTHSPGSRRAHPQSPQRRRDRHRDQPSKWPQRRGRISHRAQTG